MQEKNEVKIKDDAKSLQKQKHAKTMKNREKLSLCQDETKKSQINSHISTDKVVSNFGSFLG